MKVGVRWRLKVMMAFQYAILGSWWPILALHLGNLEISGTRIGVVYATMAVASLVSPFIWGQMADRFFPTERLLTFCHLVGGLLLFQIASSRDFGALFGLCLAYMFLYVPTMAYANSLSFHHLDRPSRDFGAIRVWGSAGWIIPAVILWFWLTLHPGCQLDGAIRLGGILSLLAAVYCLCLPHTPPNHVETRRFAPFAAAAIMRDRSFAIFLGATFLLAVSVMYHYVHFGPFLRTLGLEDRWIFLVQAGGVAVELVLVPLLPLALARMGFKVTMALGMAGWVLRLGIQAVGIPVWLVIGSFLLHGLCIAFYLIAAQVYTDSMAYGDVRASAQTIYAFVGGLGSLTGYLVAGWQRDLVSGDFHLVFFSATILAGASLAIFAIGFRNPSPEGPSPP